MIRNSGRSPACARWNRPGSSLRRARSPVAPNSTMTCGRRGEIRFVLMSVGSECIRRRLAVHRSYNLLFIGTFADLRSPSDPTDRGRYAMEQGAADGRNGRASLAVAVDVGGRA